MKTKNAAHTPGPWMISIHEDSRYTDSMAWGVCRSDGMGQIVLTRTLTEGDARLIAAAPELLAACKMALARESAQESLAGNGDKGLISMLRAAIAKANSLI